MSNIKQSSMCAVMESVSDMIYVLKVENGTFIYEYMNHAARKSMASSENFIGKTVFEANEPQLANTLHRHYQTAAYKRVCVMYKDTFISKNGTTLYADIRLNPVFDEAGNCQHIMTVVKNVTKEVNVTKLIEENLQVIADHAKDLITLINKKGDIVFASPSYKNVLGFDNTHFIDKPFLYNIYPYDQEKVRNSVENAIKNKESFTLNFRQFTQENQLIWSQAHGSPVFDKNNKLKHLIVITRDISDQKKYEAKLEYFAQHDPLTELPNRRLFKKRLTSALDTYRKNDNGVAVIMLDIDNFKEINDSYGHHVGDEVIIEFGKRIKSAIKLTNTTARLGGDEFIILLSSIQTSAQVTRVCQSIQEAIHQPWRISGHPLEITTSIGMTKVTAHHATPASMLKDADAALYEAKQSGKNTYKLAQNISQRVPIQSGRENI